MSDLSGSIASAVGRGLSWIPRRLYRSVVLAEQSRERRLERKREVLRGLAADTGTVVVASIWIGIGSGGEAAHRKEAATAAVRVVALSTEIDDDGLHATLAEFDRAARPFTGLGSWQGNDDRDVLREARDKVATRIRQLQAALE